jgi:hypothetical protein
VRGKSKLTKKQTLILGVVVSVVVIITGIAASLWLIIVIGIAMLIYTLFAVMRQKE